MNCLNEMYSRGYSASGSSASEDDMISGDELTEIVLNRDLEQQITNAIDSCFLLQLVCCLKHSCLM